MIQCARNNQLLVGHDLARADRIPSLRRLALYLLWSKIKWNSAQFENLLPKFKNKAMIGIVFFYVCIVIYVIYYVWRNRADRIGYRNFKSRIPHEAFNEIFERRARENKDEKKPKEEADQLPIQPILKGYYGILEVSFSASIQDIKANYRILAKKYHPDLNNGSKIAEEKFKELQEAYYHLSDPEKRKIYDEKMGFSTPSRIHNSEEQRETVQNDIQSPARKVPTFFFSNFLGQEKTVANLKVFIGAAKQRHGSLEHVLITGNPGSGKSTLVYAIATELQFDAWWVNAHDLNSPAGLAGVLTGLGEGDVLIIESFEKIRPIVLEYLVPALTSFQLDIVIDSGPSARSIRLSLPRFTLIAVVNDKTRLKPKLRSLFDIICNLDPMSNSALEQVVARFAKSNNIIIDSESTSLIALYCGSSSKEAFHLLKRVKDFSEVYSNGKITKDITYYALQTMGIN